MIEDKLEFGTTKFEISLYNGKNVRGTKSTLTQHYIYQQWGTITQFEDSKIRGSVKRKRIDSIQFTNFGMAIDWISRKMNKIAKRNMKARGV